MVCLSFTVEVNVTHPDGVLEIRGNGPGIQVITRVDDREMVAQLDHDQTIVLARRILADLRANEIEPETGDSEEARP